LIRFTRKVQARRPQRNGKVSIGGRRGVKSGNLKVIMQKEEGGSGGRGVNLMFFRD
jgi:hypothetical protein